MNKYTRRLGLLSASLLLPLHAGDDPYEESVVPQPTPVVDEKDGWEWSLTPFFWASGMDGTVGIGPIVAPVDLDFKDIWDNLDIAFIAAAEVRKGRWGLVTDITWLRLADDVGGDGVTFDKLDWEISESIVNLKLAYRVVDNGPTTFDVMAGARYFRAKTEIDIKGGSSDGAGVDNSSEWIDPLIGFRINHQFNDKWNGVLRADIGGFGASSDLTWEAFGGFGYQLNQTANLFAGYRHLDMDHDRSILFDAQMSGAVIGCKFSF